MKIDLLDTAISMINDYLYYGYTYNDFINQDYNITKILGKNTIKALFKQQTNYLSKQ